MTDLETIRRLQAKPGLFPDWRRLLVISGYLLGVWSAVLLIGWLAWRAL